MPPLIYLDPDLDRAYRRAHYRISGNHAELELRVDQQDPALAALLARKGVETAALITACNPGSRVADPARNEAAQRALIETVDAAGLSHLASEALDPDGRWPAEPGLLVLGIRRNAALRLARSFRQNAILWIDADATPALLWALPASASTNAVRRPDPAPDGG